MKFTLDQIREITFGATNITYEEDGSFHWYRLTQAQIDAFTAQSETFNHRAKTTAGCRLDFHTDSRHLMMQTTNAGIYEILVNGLSAAIIHDIGRCTVDLPEGESRVTILLPDHTAGAIRLLYLDEGAYYRPHVYDQKFLFLGDSIIKGSNSSRPSTSLVSRLADFFNAEFQNWAVGGSFFDKNTLTLPCFDPDVIWIGYGTNDYVRFQTEQELKQACEAYMDRVKELFPNKPIYYISPIWRADGQLVRPVGNHQHIRKIMIEQCEAHGFTHIDGYTLVPHMTEYYEDGHLHPNDLGFSVYAEKLIRAVYKDIG